MAKRGLNYSWKINRRRRIACRFLSHIVLCHLLSLGIRDLAECRPAQSAASRHAGTLRQHGLTHHGGTTSLTTTRARVHYFAPDLRFAGTVLPLPITMDPLFEPMMVISDVLSRIGVSPTTNRPFACWQRPSRSCSLRAMPTSSKKLWSNRAAVGLGL